MNASIFTHLPASLLVIALFATGLALSPSRVQAEDYPDIAYSHEELAQMLAPIALYPDALLSQVLMASTYPIEVIEADRWLRENPHLQGDVLDAALFEENWDPSVKALCHFPSVLALMSERIAETTDLGNAFLAQEEEVMDTVQELRATAYERGNLYTTSAQRVIVERETIVIQPTSPQVIYVPYYDPFTIYGSWWYPAYPPRSWGPPGVRIGFGISYWPGISLSFTFGSWTRFDWHRHHIYVDVHHRPRFVRHNHWIRKSGPWRHAPAHRHNVVYHDRRTAEKYGQPFEHRSARRDVADLSKDRRFLRDRHDDNRGRPHRQGFESSRSIQDRQARPKIDRQARQRNHRDRQRNERIEAARDRFKKAEPERQRQTNRNIQIQRQANQNRQVHPATRSNQARQMEKERDRSSRQDLSENRQWRQRPQQRTQAPPKVDRTQTSFDRQFRQRNQRDPQQTRRIENDRDRKIESVKQRQATRDIQVEKERDRSSRDSQWQKSPDPGRQQDRQIFSGGRDFSARDRDNSRRNERGRFDRHDRNHRFADR